MEKVIVYTNPTNPVAEAYHSLCANVLAGQGEKKLIEVAGVTNEHSASLVAANLAAAMAQVGKKVLLIDCNLRNPKLHEFFGLQNQGLTDCLVSVQNYHNFIQSTEQRNLDILTAGTMITNPVETLLSIPMQELLNLIWSVYDVVLLNVPAVCSVSDAAALGNKTDGVLLILVEKEDKVEMVLKAKNALSQAGVTILGCVIDKVDIS